MVPKLVSAPLPASSCLSTSTTCGVCPTFLTEKKLPRLNSPLWNWFFYNEALQAAKPGPAPVAPPAITLPSLIDSAIFWLGARDAANLPGVPQTEIDIRGPDHLLKAFDSAALPKDDLVPTYRANYAFQSKKSSLTPKSNTIPRTEPEVGTIASCTLYEPSSSLGGAAPEANLTSRVKRLLRVSVLADHWSRILVRSRIIRNARNLDSMEPDIDPAFVMPSEYSNLSGYAREKHVKDFELDDSSAPAEQTRLLVETVSLKE